jgi:hypothetical protein
MKTTIDMNGLKIEHNGGDSVLLLSEAPTEIAIGDLIEELNSLQRETSEATKSRRSPLGSLCTQPEESNRIVGFG